MNSNKIKAVKNEQHRLSAAITKLEQARAADNVEVARRKAKGETHVYSQDFPALTGAVRRASMDLTRALADLRRPN
ncbi:MAG: hypothetical protein ABW128_16920 [Rhizorhabdus sp.]